MIPDEMANDEREHVTADARTGMPHDQIFQRDLAVTEKDVGRLLLVRVHSMVQIDPELGLLEHLRKRYGPIAVIRPDQRDREVERVIELWHEAA